MRTTSQLEQRRTGPVAAVDIPDEASDDGAAAGVVASSVPAGDIAGAGNNLQLQVRAEASDDGAAAGVVASSIPAGDIAGAGNNLQLQASDDSAAAGVVASSVPAGDIVEAGNNLQLPVRAEEVPTRSAALELACRAVTYDDPDLLLMAVDSFRGPERRKLEAAMSARLLHLACKHDSTRCARLLLDGCASMEPAPVDARDPISRSPIHIAAEEGSHGCIHLLLDHKARTDLTLVVEGRSLLPLDLAMLTRIDTEWPPANATTEQVIAALQANADNAATSAISRLADNTSDTWRAGNAYPSGAAGGAGSVPVDRTQAEILYKLKVLLMLLALYTVTALVSLMAASVFAANVVSNSHRVITMIYVLQRVIAYLVLKTMQWCFADKDWIKTVLPYACFAINCLASAFFSTSFFCYMALRETILAPALIVSLLPFICFIFLKGQNITIRLLIVCSAYGLVFFYKLDEVDGRLFVPGVDPKAAFLGAALAVWSTMDELNNLRLTVDVLQVNNFLNTAFVVYQQDTLDGIRQLATTVICSIIVGAS